jgi:chromate transporter
MSAHDPGPDHASDQDSPDGADASARPPAPSPSLVELMLALAIVSISGFGGVLPWARRMLVEDRRWMTADEFTRLFAVCQFLPGPNVVNMVAVFGLRLHGLLGAVAAVVALCAAPVVLLIAIGALYTRYGAAPGIGGAIAGLAAGVAGFMIATAVRMAEPLFRKRIGIEPLIAGAAFVAIGVLRLPLFPVLATLVPVSIALAWWARR